MKDNEYKQVKQSRFLPDLDMQRLAECVAIASRPQAVQEFRKSFSRKELT